MSPPCGLGVELLAEAHDVDAVLTERGADRRRGVRLAGGELQLDVTGDLLAMTLSRLLLRGADRVRAAVLSRFAGRSRRINNRDALLSASRAELHAYFTAGLDFALDAKNSSR